MSLYYVQKLLFHLNTAEPVRERYAREREALLDEYPLTQAERTAVVAADVGALYLMGVHPQLLAPFGGRAGLSWPQYLAAIADARTATAGKR